MKRHYEVLRNSGLTRRSWLCSASVGVIACRSMSWLSALADEVALDPIPEKRRSCILLWMSGGPSQIDTFDLKPGHKNGGPFKETETSVPGLRISEHLPQLAQMMDHVAIVRSMTSKEGDHERATAYCQSGYRPGGPLKYPSLGATVSKQLQSDEAELPSYVSIAPGFFGRNVGAGFLGPRYAPLVVGGNAYGPQVDGEMLRVNNLTPPSQISASRFDNRLQILADLEQESSGDQEIIVESHQTSFAQALRMVQGHANEVFDLTREAPALRDAYGRNPFGQGCLMARRLVEHGVPFVDVSLNGVPNANVFGWDTHNDNFETVKKLSGVLDAGFATLLRDLKSRGLLENTVIVWMGEFGRTPTINGATGRDHFPNAWSTVLAGGGIHGGQAIGKTSDDGREVTDHPVSIPDLLSTVCSALGVDAHKQNMSNIGRPIRVVDPDAKPIQEALV